MLKSGNKGSFKKDSENKADFNEFAKGLNLNLSSGNKESPFPEMQKSPSDSEKTPLKMPKNNYYYNPNQFVPNKFTPQKPFDDPNTMNPYIMAPFPNMPPPMMNYQNPMFNMNPTQNPYPNESLMNMAVNISKGNPGFMNPMNPAFMNPMIANMMNTPYVQTTIPYKAQTTPQGKEKRQGKGKFNPNNTYIKNQSSELERMTFDELLTNLLQLCKEPGGSRFVQKKYDELFPEQKTKVINSILPEIISLSTDCFGNYLIQKLMEGSSTESRQAMLDMIHGNIMLLTKNKFGCRVIQKIIELFPKEEIDPILKELNVDLPSCILDEHGNHVINKLIEKASNPQKKEVLKAIEGNVFELSKDEFGCRVVQQIYVYSLGEDKEKIKKEVLDNYNDLSMDKFGNYVVQKIIKSVKYESRKSGNEFYEGLKGKVFEYSGHQFASNVLETCLSEGTEEQNKKLIDEIINQDNMNGKTILPMVSDKCGNYVIQKMIEVASKDDRDILIKRILNTDLKKTDVYTKHVLSYINKLNIVKTQAPMKKRPDQEEQ
ncbi:MAG: hypothetical protein MJ252_24325 [archaeon]|nr:hypothetical protein [archaeon]